MSKINTIIFDLGGVLVDWNPDYLYTKIFDDPEKMKWFYKNICTPEWNMEQDAGRSLQHGTDLLVKQFPEYAKEISMYYGRWTEMLKGPIHETVEIFKSLKESGKYKLYALTNWSHETFPIALEMYEFLHWFDGRVVSGDEKTRKPFPEIYHTLINRYSIEPTKALYTDDNAYNLLPAQQLGMTTIHFQSPGQFRKELENLRIL
ncbi:MAG: HAD family hydrolase [Bacteroidetes bacterium]|nr:MAG: HAD family hydrolase [Bacteroidota bacterium]